MTPDSIQVRLADLSTSSDAEAMLLLLDSYATDLMGGGAPLREDVRVRLPGDLHARPGTLVLIAWIEAAPAGLAIAFEGYSTFEARRLLNLHDFVVAPSFRGRGVARQLLSALEGAARERDCCKITLEVLENNGRARGIYAQAGFAGYELDPAAGKALFLQKKLS